MQKKIKEGMCLVELRNETDKGTVMKNKAKLKEIKEPRVYINDDMSKIEREIQKKNKNQGQRRESRWKQSENWISETNGE
jgi:hypothetical protein